MISEVFIIFIEFNRNETLKNLNRIENCELEFLFLFVEHLTTILVYIFNKGFRFLLIEFHIYVNLCLF